MKILLITLIGFLIGGTQAFAKEYPISSAAELSNLKLKPGDKVILKDLEWKDQRLVFTGNGSPKLPITLITEKPGKTRMTGNSTLLVDGNWLVVDGLSFANGFSLKEDVILFSKTSTYCRVTNTAIVDYNPPSDTIDYRWVSLNGRYNRVDHCFFSGKNHQGPTLVVWLTDHPNYHTIDHNYFGPRPELGRNGGETIRIGTSTWSFYDSYTKVEKNIFENCDGELEIISNKSCKNTLRDNLFFECKGTLTLRHGNDAEVYGNYFIGNNLPGTGGIRVIGENHRVHHNYLQDLTGTGVSAAISIMAGLPNPELTSHWQVKNASITDNVIVNCKESFSIGAGKNPQRNLPALNTVFARNQIVTSHQAIHWVDDSVVIRFSENVVWNSSDTARLPRGFIVKDPQLLKNINGLYQPRGTTPIKPFWMREKVGPWWKKEQFVVDSR